MTPATPPPIPQSDQDDGPLMYWPLDEVRTDVFCPNCDQNLRGLRGRVVSCPECGHRCDIAKLVQLYWDPPLAETPYIKTVLAPASFLFASLLVLTLILVPLRWLRIPHEGWIWSLPMIGSVWGILIVRVWLLIGVVRGSVLVLLGHGLLMALVLLLIAVMSGIVLGLMIWQQYAVLNQLSFWVAVIATAGAMLTAWPAWRCRHLIKRRCIETYMRQAAMRL